MTQENTEFTDQAEPESINLNDLAMLAQVVELASSRGAFRAEELTAVGKLYDKLRGFLTAVQQQQAAQDDAQGSEEKVQ